jgi:hypothetical protein
MRFRKKAISFAAKGNDSFHLGEPQEYRLSDYFH